MAKQIDDKDLKPVSGGGGDLSKGLDTTSSSMTRPTGPLQGENKDEVDGTSERD